MSLTQLRIAIIEDNDEDIALLERLLQHMKYQVEIAVFKTGEKAVTYYAGTPSEQAFKANLIILDLGLPGEHGLETLKKLKEIESLKQVPVMVVTASDEKEDMKNTYELGGTLFVQKPWKEAVLSSAITQLRSMGVLTP